MKTLAWCAATAFALGASASNAVATEYVWTGMTVFYSTSGCTAGWNPANSIFQTRFRPSGIGTNGTNSDWNIFDKIWATGFRTAGRYGATAKSATAMVVGTGQGNYPSATIAFLSQVPATLSANTAFINITGTINNFDDSTGCLVNFKSTLTKLPW